MAKSFLGLTAYPRGIRNNNPANLRLTSENWQGKVPNSQNTDGAFEQFYELRYGLRAMMRNIITQVERGHNTIFALISVLSPSIENNTEEYIKAVVSSLGLAPFGIIDLTEDTMIRLCKIIATMENGAEYAKLITDTDYKQAIAILGKPLKKKAVIQP